MTCWFNSFIMLNWWTKRFFPEPKKNSNSRIWNIKQVKIDLGSFACKHIIFLPAMLGCDTTSWLYGVGKGTILKTFKTNFELQKATEAFDTILSTSSQIVSAGESVLVIMYGCKTNESLKTLRWRKYCEKLATSLAHIDPKGLPPTSAASKYHSYRVYYQICQWKSSECDMLPESWGWISVSTPPRPICHQPHLHLHLPHLWHVGSVMELHASMLAHLLQMMKNHVMKNHVMKSLEYISRLSHMQVLSKDWVDKNDW